MKTIIEATRHNKEIFISHKDSLAAALKFAAEKDSRSDLNSIFQTSRIIRKDLLSKSEPFNGHLKNESRATSDNLELLINLILGITGHVNDDTQTHT